MQTISMQTISSATLLVSVLASSTASAQSELNTFTKPNTTILDVSDDGLTVLAKTNQASSTPNRLFLWTPASGWVSLLQTADGARLSGNGQVIVAWTLGPGGNELILEGSQVKVFRSNNWITFSVVGVTGNAFGDLSATGDVVNAACNYAVPNTEITGYGTARWRWNGQAYVSELQTNLSFGSSASNDGAFFGLGSPNPSVAAGPAVLTAPGEVTLFEDPDATLDFSVKRVSPDGNAILGVWCSAADESCGPTIWVRSNGVWNRNVLLPHPVLGSTLFVSAISNAARIIGGESLIWAGTSAPAQTVGEFLTSRGLNVSNWVDLRVADVSADGRTLVGSGNLLGQGVQLWYATLPVPCDADFNNNTVFPEDQDVIDFFDVLAGGPCSTPTPPGCDPIDVNLNGVFPEDQDVIDFFNTLAGAEPCGS